MSKSYNAKDISQELDFTSLSMGIYNLTIDYENGFINKKIVIKK